MNRQLHLMAIGSSCRMKRLLRIAVQSLVILFVTPIAHGQIADVVDPFLGASGGGNVFPGPAVPFGMIKPGSDMINLHHGDPNAGWNANDDIAGFSQTHVSGTAQFRITARRRACIGRPLLGNA